MRRRPPRSTRVRSSAASDVYKRQIMVDVAVVDYGMGNLRSVEQALRNVAPTAEIVVTDDAGVIANAKRVVFPGQGAMPDCMRELDARGLRDAVLDAARSRPFLGICIG